MLEYVLKPFLVFKTNFRFSRQVIWFSGRGHLASDIMLSALILIKKLTTSELSFHHNSRQKAQALESDHSGINGGRGRTDKLH